MTKQKAPEDRQRHPPEVRRRMILDVAQECIVEHSLAGTTVREIAARGGISTGTITYHFASIDEILGEVLRNASTRFAATSLSEARKRERAIDQLYYVIDRCLPTNDESIGLWRLWLDFWARAARDPQLAAVHSERHSFEREALRGIIQDGIESGEFRVVDAEWVAAEILGLLDGLGLQATIGDVAVDVDVARSVLRSAIEARLLPPASNA
jgi:AcrR family transcriptional regulator